MRYFDNIILDKNIKNIDLFFINKIAVLDYYAICVSEKGNGLMEIISVRNLLKTVNEYKNYGIIAVVKGKITAQELSAKLVESWLKKNENLDNFRNYYNQNCR